MNQENVREEFLSTPSDPRARNTAGARVPNKAIKKQRLLVGATQKAVWEMRTRRGCFSDTAKHAAPIFNCIF